MIGYTSAAAEIARQLSRIEGARSSLVLNRDGTPATETSVDELEQIFGSLTGAIFRTINKATQSTGFGELEHVVITAGSGTIVAVAAGKYVFVVVGEADANVGLLRLGIRSVALSLSEGDGASA